MTEKWTAFVAYGDTSNPTRFVVVLDDGTVWQPASVTVTNAAVTVSNVRTVATNG